MLAELGQFTNVTWGIPDCPWVNRPLTTEARSDAHDGRNHMFAFTLLFRDRAGGENIRPL